MVAHCAPRSALSLARQRDRRLAAAAAVLVLAVCCCGGLVEVPELASAALVAASGVDGALLAQLRRSGIEEYQSLLDAQGLRTLDAIAAASKHPGDTRVDAVLAAIPLEHRSRMRRVMQRASSLAGVDVAPGSAGSAPAATGAATSASATARSPAATTTATPAGAAMQPISLSSSAPKSEFAPAVAGKAHSRTWDASFAGTTASSADDKQGQGASADGAAPAQRALPPPRGWSAAEPDCLAVRAAVGDNLVAVCIPTAYDDGTPAAPIVVLWTEDVQVTAQSYCARLHITDDNVCSRVTDTVAQRYTQAHEALPSRADPDAAQIAGVRRMLDAVTAIVSPAGGRAAGAGGGNDGTREDAITKAKTLSGATCAELIAGVVRTFDATMNEREQRRSRELAVLSGGVTDDITKAAAGEPSYTPQVDAVKRAMHALESSAYEGDYGDFTLQAALDAVGVAARARDVIYASLGPHRAQAARQAADFLASQTVHPPSARVSLRLPPQSHLPEGVMYADMAQYVRTVNDLLVSMKLLAASLLGMHRHREALAVHRRLYRMRGESGFGRRSSSIINDGTQLPRSTRHKLLHDAEQLQYLLANSLLATPEERAEAVAHAASGNTTGGYVLDAISLSNAATGAAVRESHVRRAGLAASLGSGSIWRLSPTAELWAPYILSTEAPMPQMDQQQARDALEMYRSVIKSAGGDPVVGEETNWFWDAKDAERGPGTKRADWRDDMLVLPAESVATLRESRLLEEAGHVAALAPLRGPAINPTLNLTNVTETYLNSDPHIIVVDDFLSSEALAALRRFVHESRVFHAAKAAYEGAYLDYGFAPDVLGQLADELHDKLPRIFCNHTLHQSWAYKYDTELASGTAVHADNASVNFNVWVSDDDASLDDVGAGLEMYPVKPPADWGFDDYNSAPLTPGKPAVDRIASMVEEYADSMFVVPHKPNRVVLFDSDLLHGSGTRIRMKRDYKSRRINVTLLFGMKGDMCAQANERNDRARQHAAETAAKLRGPSRRDKAI